MQYSDEKYPDLEKGFEWLAGPLVIAILTAVIWAVLLPPSTGF